MKLFTKSSILGAYFLDSKKLINIEITSLSSVIQILISFDKQMQITTTKTNNIDVKYIYILGIFQH